MNEEKYRFVINLFGEEVASGFVGGKDAEEARDMVLKAVDVAVISND